MTDFHSHILPGIDDGAKNTDESLSLLRMLSGQGVDTVVATPHFYADIISVDDLLESRNRSVAALREALGDGADFNVPRVICGSEVRYYDGISRLDGLERMCIGGTKLLLLEMPFTKWSDYTVREITGIATSRRVKLILAHIERYLPYGNLETLYKFHDLGILMQSNASNFIEFSSKRRAIRHLKSGLIDLLGSDCHSISHRPPRLDEAEQKIVKKLGIRFAEEMEAFATDLQREELSCL